MDKRSAGKGNSSIGKGIDMTISRIAHLAEPALTNQQLADLALTAWQSARRAAQRGEIALARKYRAEGLRLVSLIKEI